MEVVAECKVLLVNYICDICKNGICSAVDSTSVKNDDGEYHVVVTHKCNNCGAQFDLEDVRYPYPKLIPIEKLRPYKEDELQ